MIKFKWPIQVEKKEKKFITLNCNKCAKPFFVIKENIRTSNYCSSC